MTTRPESQKPPTLRELCHKDFAHDRGRFLAEYPRPALILPAFVESPTGDPDADTEELGPTAVFATARSEAGFKTFFNPDDEDESAVARSSRKRIASGEGVVFQLTKSGRNSFAEMITVGRATNNDIVIPSGTVSKLHGYFMQAPGGTWRFCDTGSMNGVLVRGKRVTSRTTVDLEDGDEILLGPDVPTVFRTPEGLFELLAKLRSLP